ncbi:MAG: hypothetical protein WA840_09505, partial [Caulobacteraceae bacterium]
MTVTGVERPKGEALVRTGAVLAALPMYDLPEVQAANDALWAALRDRLDDAGVEHVPRALTRGADLDALWTRPNLLLAQTCG